MLAIPELSRVEAERIAACEGDRDALFACLSEVAAPVGPLGRDEFDEALAGALRAHAAYREEVRRSAGEALAWVRADGSRRGVVIDCRPYLYDPVLSNRIDELLAGLGVAVVPSRFMERASEGRRIAKGLWKRSGHLAAALEAVLPDRQLELVALRSFGCGYDAVSYDEAREVLASCGRPFTELVVDEMVDVAHLRIRLRTLVETMAGNHGEKGGVAAGRAYAEKGAVSTMDALATGTNPSTACGEAPADPSRCLRIDEVRIGEDDVELARTRATHDLCITVKALAARSARELSRADDGTRALRLPRPCLDCLELSLPFEIHRLIGEDVSVTWEDDSREARASRWGDCARVDASGARSELAPADGLPGGPARPRRPLVGLVGNPLLVFDPLMNEDVAGLLDRLGCEVAWPDPASLLVDDVRYEAQLDEFAGAGVDCVIYLQSFGCLKGHVQARGAARWFKERYPGMPVTVIDYDPESSALNRENRIRLAVFPTL